MADFLYRLKSGLSVLGVKRLVTLGLMGIFIFGLIAAGSYRLSRPTREVLYTGLDLQDVSQIGAVLEESGIGFDVNAEGTAVLVDNGHTAEARMLLAEKGLPKGDKSGYELFDNLGSLGLTSFMQQVTKVRALEGELARTIQLMKGIKAARVHIVMAQEGSFRNAKESPSASVIIRTEGQDGKGFAPAIQQLVAAAIPGMTREMVSVLGTDGTILASSGTSLTAGPEQMVGLEQQLAKGIEERITQTLAPALGLDNFRISVAAKLNTDRKETSETIFDPESRVERSVKSVKELGEAQNKNSQQSVSVEQNVPTETPVASNGSGDQSSEKNDKREELTNYEINSKLVATKSEGYNIENLSIAIVVNRAQVIRLAGASPTPQQVNEQIQELQSVASSAAGLSEKRGDSIKVTAVDFMAEKALLDPLPGSGMTGILTENLSAIINAAAMVIVVLLALFLGLKPALRMILAPPVAAADSTDSPPLISNQPASTAALPNAATEEALIASPPPRLVSPAQQRLEQLVAQDREKAARILKAWLNDQQKSAA